MLIGVLVLAVVHMVAAITVAVRVGRILQIAAADIRRSAESGAQAAIAVHHALEVFDGRLRLTLPAVLTASIELRGIGPDGLLPTTVVSVVLKNLSPTSA